MSEAEFKKAFAQLKKKFDLP